MTIKVGDTIVITKSREPTHLTVGRKYTICEIDYNWLENGKPVVRISGEDFCGNVWWVATLTGGGETYNAYELIPKTFQDEIKHKILSGGIKNV